MRAYSLHIPSNLKSQILDNQVEEDEMGRRGTRIGYWWESQRERDL
jgi:hypothetical protein